MSSKRASLKWNSVPTSPVPFVVYIFMVYLAAVTRIGLLLTIALVCSPVLATDEQAITVTESSIDQNAVRLKAILHGESHEFVCGRKLPSCSEVVPGEYTMVLAAAAEGIYQDCTNVLLYKSSGAAREKVGVYCWASSGDCYMVDCRRVEVPTSLSELPNRIRDEGMRTSSLVMPPATIKPRSMRCLYLWRCSVSRR